MEEEKVVKRGTLILVAVMVAILAVSSVLVFFIFYTYKTSQQKELHSELLVSTSALINGSAYNTGCNCTAPGVWSWVYNRTLSSQGYIIVSLSRNVSMVEVSYNLNGTTPVITWCFGNMTGCNKSMRLVVPVMGGMDNFSVLLLNYGISSVSVGISVEYYWYS